MLQVRDDVIERTSRRHTHLLSLGRGRKQREYGTLKNKQISVCQVSLKEFCHSRRGKKIILKREGGKLPRA
uniref:Uncharacterized protein n=1 Tax=Octopus bimaculoides TaxID=37653 RepID=A0A0L8HHL1_OCTBM